MTAIDEILDQEEQLVNAKRALDLEALDRIYADDLLLTGVLGEPTCSKNAVMDDVADLRLDQRPRCRWHV